MREVVFALEFRGQAGPVPGSEGRRRARSTAPSQILRTVLGRAGVVAAVEPVAGESAVLEAEVERAADGTFTERGAIVYGSLGRITFTTLGRGVVGPAPLSGWMRGGVVWEVTGGEGGLAGARGLITSNFTVHTDGTVVDHHVARLYLPDVH